MNTGRIQTGTEQHVRFFELAASIFAPMFIEWRASESNRSTSAVRFQTGPQSIVYTDTVSSHARA